MTFQITVDSNASQLAAILGGVAREQIPFATAQALTDVAFAGMQAAKSELEKSLTLRNRFSAAGIQVNRAEKSDWPNTAAEVGIEERRSYLIDHVTGKRRKPKESPFKAVPNPKVVKRSKSGKIPARMRPKRLLDRAGHRVKGAAHRYIVSYESGGDEALWRYTKGDSTPELVYYFTKTARIKDTFDMPGAVRKRAADVYDDAIFNRLTKAMASAKSRASKSARGVGLR